MSDKNLPSGSVQLPDVNVSRRQAMFRGVKDFQRNNNNNNRSNQNAPSKQRSDDGPGGDGHGLPPPPNPGSNGDGPPFELKNNELQPFIRGVKGLQLNNDNNRSNKNPPSKQSSGDGPGGDGHGPPPPPNPGPKWWDGPPFELENHELLRGVKGKSLQANNNSNRSNKNLPQNRGQATSFSSPTSFRRVLQKADQDEELPDHTPSPSTSVQEFGLLPKTHPRTPWLIHYLPQLFALLTLLLLFIYFAF